MKRLVIAAAAIAATLTLAACGNAPEQPAAETPAATAPAVETPAAAPAAAAETPAAPAAVSGETVVPGTDMTVNQAMEAAQAQAANMTPEQKQAAVTEARTQAEAAAKAAGMTDEQVKQTGDAAEAAAKQMLGVQ